MSFGKCHKSICLDDILNKVSEADILNYYLGISALPILINSPFRQDNNPSVSIFINNNNNVIFKDFGTHKSYNIWSFFEEYWNCTYEEVLLKITEDLNNMKIGTSKIKITKHKQYVHNSSIIEVTIREWRDYDLCYWESFGINLEWLKFGRIFPISHIFINNNRFPAEKYAYVYVEKKDGNITLKIYQPFSERMKWLSKHDNSVWDLWDRLPPKGNKLIITSSRKDALCIWANTGVPSTCLQGEGYIPKEHIIQQLKDRFEVIYVLYDNDFHSDINNGRIFGKNLADKFNLIQIEIPDEWKCKDISDLCFNWGKDIVKQVITELIN
jgi:hypothetical protein